MQMVRFPTSISSIDAVQRLEWATSLATNRQTGPEGAQILLDWSWPSKGRASQRGVMPWKFPSRKIWYNIVMDVSTVSIKALGPHEHQIGMVSILTRGEAQKAPLILQETQSDQTIVCYLTGGIWECKVVSSYSYSLVAISGVHSRDLEEPVLGRLSGECMLICFPECTSNLSTTPKKGTGSLLLQGCCKAGQGSR